MGEVNRKRRHQVIKQKKEKRAKIQRLMEKYTTADPREKEKLAEKIRKLSPGYPLLPAQKTRP